MQNSLTRQNLDQLTLCWENWEAEATTASRRIVRARLHLLFLLIRFAGLRLGEALELDAKAAVDTVTCMVHIPGAGARDVLLPISCMRNIRRILSLPEAEEMGADFLRFDQGFVRRKFYEVAKPLELDSALVGPRALRYARGLELLELHVPFNLVQKFLGLQKSSQVAAFLEFAGGEARRLVQAGSSSGTENREDCRNSMLGVITDIELGMRSVLVEVTTFSDLHLVAMCSHKEFSRMDLHMKQVVTAFIDPDQVVIAPEAHAGGFSNRLCGTVEELHREQIETFIGVQLADRTKIYSNQETSVLDSMRLYDGKKVWLFFPARAVKLSVR
ncbi:MAG: transporter [Mailhella sp.]|nr:transporter [Mailhella sp.]